MHQVRVGDVTARAHHNGREKEIRNVSNVMRTKGRLISLPQNPVRAFKHIIMHIIRGNIKPTAVSADQFSATVITPFSSIGLWWAKNRTIHAWVVHESFVGVYNDPCVGRPWVCSAGV